MISFLPATLLVAGMLGAYLRGGRWRLGATLALLLATAASLALVAEARIALGWLMGPLLATLLVARPARAQRLSFEAVTRRAITLAASLLVAIFIATKFPLAENPAALSMVPWLLGAVGAAWLISPIDAAEATQARVLLVSCGAALLLALGSNGPVTAAVAGAMALVPAIGARWELPRGAARLLPATLLAVAAAVATLALLAGSLPHPAIEDLALSLEGLALPAAAVLLLAAGLGERSDRLWLVLPGLLAVLAVAPSLRWAGLAALVAGAAASRGDGDIHKERLAWLALLLLATTTLFASLSNQPWSPRAQIALLAGALVLMAIAYSANRGSVVILCATTLAVLQDIGNAGPGLISRFQWVTAAGALLLVARSVLAWRSQPGDDTRLEQPLRLGLLLLAAGAHDQAGLGQLAALLLVLDLALLPDRLQAESAAGALSGRRWLLGLSASAWPPTLRFAGVTLAVIAALQTSLAWGLLAAALLMGLKLAPVIGRGPRAEPGAQPSMRAATASIVALACGVAPALLLRMLRV